MNRVIESLSFLLTLLVLGTHGTPQQGHSGHHGTPQQGQSGHHGTPQQGHSGHHGSTDPITAQLNSYGYEHVGRGKYALVVSGYTTWVGAYHACKSQLPGASLFLVNNAQDSAWLGQRINHQKDRVNGASKFWVGLISRAANGPLVWLDGGAYQNFAEVVQVSGYDDGSKHFAWAVPDSFSRLKYEFLTVDDEAESYICQYIRS